MSTEETARSETGTLKLVMSWKIAFEGVQNQFNIYNTLGFTNIVRKESQISAITIKRSVVEPLGETCGILVEFCKIPWSI
jgi:hypothetical protein